jgi:hypothetical protein
MLLGLCLASVGLLAWFITALPARQAGGDAVAPGRPRDLDRHLTGVRAHPGRATRLDLGRLLGTALPPTEVARVLSIATDRELPLPLMWRWAERFGAERLALALDAEVAERSMERHLTSGTTPDWRAMVVLAALAHDDVLAPPPGEREDLGRAPGAVHTGEVADAGPSWAPNWGPDGGHDLSGFGKLPPIYGPARLSERPPGPDPTGGWPLAS